MATQFYPITLSEMEPFLKEKGFKKLQGLPQTNEIVFGRRVDRNDQQMSLRVYTALTPAGQSRPCGDDAMRVVIAWRKAGDQKPQVVGRTKRVHRVVNWRTNLADRINQWHEMLADVTCVCNAPMASRKGQFGPFLKCLSCGKTRNVAGKKS